MAISLGAVKRGDTVAFSLELMDGDSPVTGVAASLKCQIREKENSKSSLLGQFDVVENHDNPGVYSFLFEGDTRSWPSKVYFDIEWESDGTISSSDSFLIKIKEDITNG